MILTRYKNDCTQIYSIARELVDTVCKYPHSQALASQTGGGGVEERA